MYIRNPGHMTKMAAMPIYGKNPSKIFFSRIDGPISTKLGMKHQCLKQKMLLCMFCESPSINSEDNALEKQQHILQILRDGECYS